MNDLLDKAQEPLAKLREVYTFFMRALAAIPCSQHQKQLAFIRFDEGHMWMQNAILSLATANLESQVLKEDESNEG